MYENEQIFVALAIGEVPQAKSLLAKTQASDVMLQNTMPCYSNDS